MEVINDVLGYKNLKIYQNTDMFQFSLDSVMLANFVTINKNVINILDIGTGNAVIPLILSTKTQASITGIEIQKEVADLASKSVELNQLSNQVDIVNEDVKEYCQFDTEKFDVITCNPPFFKINEQSNLNVSIYKQIARHELTLDLESLIKVVKRLLKNGGYFAMVHRPERLIEIIQIMKENNIEPKKIQLIYPKKESNANILLIEGVKNGKPGLKILPPIISHNEDGSYSKQIEQYFS